jgi:hypothetical protein
MNPTQELADMLLSDAEHLLEGAGRNLASVSPHLPANAIGFGADGASGLYEVGSQFKSLFRHPHHLAFRHPAARTVG